MQGKLENAKQAAGQAKAQTAELTKLADGLNSELEKVNTQRSELQTKLDQAMSEITSAQSQLEDKQSRLGGELENAKQAADQDKSAGYGTRETGRRSQLCARESKRSTQ